MRPSRRWDCRITTLLPAFFAAMLALGSSAALGASAELPERDNGHRPLRANPQDDAPDPQPAQSFLGYDGAPDFTVVPRIEQLGNYPCAACHAHLEANPERRKLSAPHPAALDHGDGRLWCLDCHDADSRNELVTSAGERVSFDRADLVCGQCHGAVHRDWVFGVHGKRVADWQGPREYYACAHCHDPHDPAVRPRAPEPPPKVRAGLEPMPDGNHHQTRYPWRAQEQESDDEEQAGQ